MTCRGCGEKISVIGKVCPHCLRDKTTDAADDSRAFLFGAGFALLGVLLGVALPSTFLGKLLGAFLGVFVGLIVGMALAWISSKPSPPSLPPEVRVTPQSSRGSLEAVQSSIGTAGERLEQLRSLRDKELISEEEYAAQRQEILKSI